MTTPFPPPDDGTFSMGLRCFFSQGSRPQVSEIKSNNRTTTRTHVKSIVFTDTVGSSKRRWSSIDPHSFDHDDRPVLAVGFLTPTFSTSFFVLVQVPRSAYGLLELHGEFVAVSTL